MKYLIIDLPHEDDIFVIRDGCLAIALDPHKQEQYPVQLSTVEADGPGDWTNDQLKSSKRVGVKGSRLTISLTNKPR